MTEGSDPDELRSPRARSVEKSHFGKFKKEPPMPKTVAASNNGFLDFNLTAKLPQRTSFKKQDGITNKGKNMRRNVTFKLPNSDELQVEEEEDVIEEWKQQLERMENELSY